MPLFPWPLFMFFPSLPGIACLNKVIPYKILAQALLSEEPRGKWLVRGAVI